MIAVIYSNRNYTYARPHLIAQLYIKYREQRYAIDQLRKRRNEHATNIRNVLAIEKDHKREQQMRRHQKIGVSFKNDIKK